MEMDDDGMDMGNMNMSFAFSCEAGDLLFGWWKIKSCTSFYLSCFPVILLSVARHYVFSIATSMAAPTKGLSVSRTTSLLDSSGFETSSGRALNKLGRWKRFAWTMASTAGSALSLLSMLVVMTYNSGLFIAVLIGEAIGFWVWGTLPEGMRACH